MSTELTHQTMHCFYNIYTYIGTANICHRGIYRCCDDVQVQGIGAAWTSASASFATEIPTGSGLVATATVLLVAATALTTILSLTQAFVRMSRALGLF